MRWEYGSPYCEQNNYTSNFDPISQTLLMLSPGAVAGNGITPTSGSGVYCHTLVDLLLRLKAARQTSKAQYP